MREMGASSCYGLPAPGILAFPKLVASVSESRLQAHPVGEETPVYVSWGASWALPLCLPLGSHRVSHGLVPGPRICGP